jgi:hypothetical protein
MHIIVVKNAHYRVSIELLLNAMKVATVSLVHMLHITCSLEDTDYLPLR